MGRVLSLAEAHRVRADLQTAGQSLAFANGHFDLLHVGHARYLAHAGQRADRLMVGINGDQSTRRLKGPGRPLVPGVERAELVAALAAVDYVVIFEEDSPACLLESLKPELHCKGTDPAPSGRRSISFSISFSRSSKSGFDYDQSRTQCNVRARLSSDRLRVGPPFRSVVWRDAIQATLSPER